jgi:hypothetical protein
MIHAQQQKSVRIHQLLQSSPLTDDLIGIVRLSLFYLTFN